MKSINLFENIEFNPEKAHADPILADEHNRIIRFILEPGQELKEHRAPSSAVRIVVLQGHGLFRGENNQEVVLSPNSLVVYEPEELHSVQALDDTLVFVAILENTPALQSEYKPVGLMVKH